MPRRIAALAAMLALLFAADARSQIAPFPPPAFATVDVLGETFVILIEDQFLLDEVYLIILGIHPPRGVMGFVESGNQGYNRDLVTGAWSWHLRANSISLVEVTIELCDGLPSFVEAANYEFGQFCPWNSVIIDVYPAAWLSADTNVDGEVDQLDADRVASCFTAPGQQCAQIASECCQGDINSDREVDCDDWAAIEAQWTASGEPTAPVLCRSGTAVPAFPAPGLWLALAAVGVLAAAARRRG